MEGVLAGLARERCLVYLDDVLVMGKTFAEHLYNLREVFGRLSTAGLKLKPAKCHLMKEEVLFLGYVVSARGISADPEKVRAMVEFPTPCNLRSLRAFLGLTSHYRWFVPRFSAVAQPLYRLTRKSVPYKWTTDCEVAFTHLKRALTEAPVLVYPQFGHPFLLENDASGMGLRAVLSQKQEDGTTLHMQAVYSSNKSGTSGSPSWRPWALCGPSSILDTTSTAISARSTHEALKARLNTPQPSGKLAR